MTRFLFTALIAIIANDAIGQTCADCRYISTVFDSVTVKTVKFGQGPRANGNIQELYMDIYEPYGDTASSRAVAVFAFGGAFITGSRDDWYVVLACEELAKSGYVVASIDYRIYDDIGQMILEIFSAFPPQQMRIFFRPMQDMRAAVQYLKADFAELGNNYRIDTSKILIGGASSGAMTSLMTAYCDKDSEMAEMGGGSLVPLDALGGFYSTSGFYPNYNWNALATFNVSGALINADWIEPGDIPVICIHGNADDIVPYKEGGFAGLTLGTFNMQGSYLVDSIARTKGVCSYLYTMEGKGHPSEDFGIEYIKSVVYRMMLRMHAVLNERSFCCGLDLNVNPVDTLYYEAGGDPVTLTATVANGSGNEQISWCGIKCLASGSSPTITVAPADTNLRYIACVAHEGQCQDVTLNMVKILTATSSMQAINRNEMVIEVYPQPVSGSFTLHAEFPEPLNQTVSVEIFDIAGERVYAREVYANDRLNETIDVKELETGSYILKLSAPEILQYQKLIITANK